MSDHSIDAERGEWHIAVVTSERPPANFLSLEMIGELADTLEAICDDGQHEPWFSGRTKVSPQLASVAGQSSAIGRRARDGGQLDC